MKNLTESATYTANVSVPEDNADLRTAASVETAFQALTNRTKYIKDRIVSDEWVYPTGKTRTTTIYPCDAGRDGTWTFTPTALTATGASAYATVSLNLSKHVPDGATITRVRALVDPGAARTGSNRMTLALYERVFGFASPSVPAATQRFIAYDNATGSLQSIDSGTISVAVSRNSGQALLLWLSCGNDANVNYDAVYGFEITWTDPGPRNF